MLTGALIEACISSYVLLSVYLLLCLLFCSLTFWSTVVVIQRALLNGTFAALTFVNVYFSIVLTVDFLLVKMAVFRMWTFVDFRMATNIVYVTFARFFLPIYDTSCALNLYHVVKDTLPHTLVIKIKGDLWRARVA